MKFRRKQSDRAEEPDVETPDAWEPNEAEQTPAGEPGMRTDGPWDVSEVELDEDDPNAIDLGGLIVRGQPGIELQMQVEEQTGEVIAVLLASADGAVELRPFAAPRHGDIWDDARRSIAAEVTQHGGTATEADGPFGKELHVMMTVQTPEGETGQQPSRVLGIPGPRWMLRATLFGRPALDPAEDGDVESALREVIVVRGSEPMPPGDPLPLTVPANAEFGEPG